MKIAHVVTYVSPDGAFGGPVRVALGQAEALAERGHEVTVYAGAPPELAGVTKQHGYTLKTFPARRIAPGGGFAFMMSPALTRAVKKEAASIEVAHIHLARDLVTIPPALAIRRAGTPYVVQTHGMIDATDKSLAKPLDTFAIEPLLREASGVLTLTDREDEEIVRIAPSAKVERIVNGIRIDPLPPYEGRENVVLFLARLQSRKRPLAFVEMARLLDDSLPETRFVLVGPDEGEGDSVKSAIGQADMGERLQWTGSVSPIETDRLLASARAYVLPAVGEVFPMTILESLRVGTPVVTTQSLGIAPDCERYGAAVVTDGTPRELAAAVAEILSSQEEAGRLRAGGLHFLKAELDIARVATRLESIYVKSQEPMPRSLS